MAFIVTSACVGCKDTHCVQICPVDCFYEGPNMLVIDPDECIDCALCVPECPVSAIYADSDIPEDQIPFIEINAIKSQDPAYQNITDVQQPMATSSPYTTAEAILLMQNEV
jgi:ferredoxin